MDVTLLSVLTTRYCIPQEWQTVLYQICSTTDPFDLRCESVAYNYVTQLLLVKVTANIIILDQSNYLLHIS